MKVLLVSHIPKGGVNTYVTELMSGFIKNNIQYECYFICDESEKVNFQDNDSVYGFNLPLSITASLESDIRVPEIENHFKNFLLTNQFDVIDFQHVQHIGASLVNVAKQFNTRVVMTIHDYWTICPNLFLYKKNFSLCSGPNQGRECVTCYNNQEDVLLERYTYFNNILCNVVDEIIVVSKSIAIKLIQEGIPEKKIRIVYPNISNEKNKKSKKDYRNNKMKVGYVGVVEAIKGAHLFLAAYEKMKELDIEFHVFGKVKDFQGEINKLLENDNFIIHGVFQSQELPNLIKDMDYIVIPSIVPEAGPLTVQEVLKNKIPVVGSNIGGIPEYVNNNCGVLFEAGNINDLVEKLLSEMKSPKMYNFENQVLLETDNFIENIIACYENVERDSLFSNKTVKMEVCSEHQYFLEKNNMIFNERQVLNYSIPKLLNKIKNNNYYKIVIFGFGKNGKKTFKYLQSFNIHIDYFIDNNPLNKNFIYENVRVLPLSHIIEEGIKLDLVIIVADSEQQMKQQFIDMYKISNYEIVGLREMYYESINIEY